MTWRIGNAGALSPGESVVWMFYLDNVNFDPGQKIQVIWAVPELLTTLEITNRRMAMQPPIDKMWIYSLTLTNVGSVTSAYDIVGAEIR